MKDPKKQATSKKWKPPPHLPSGLLPGGVAERVLKAAAERGHVEICTLDDLNESLVSIRRHPLLNSPPATESAEKMKEQYRAVLLKEKEANRFFRYCLGLHAGIEWKDTFREKALETYRTDPDVYLDALGELVPEELRIQAEEERYQANSNPTASGDWSNFMRRLDDHQEQETQGLKTGLKRFDEGIDGLRDTTILAGLTNSGKTTLALNIAAGVLRANKNCGVVVFSLETTKDNYYTKMLSLESGVDYRTLKKEWPDNVADAVTNAQGRLASEILPRLLVLDRIEGTMDGSLTLDRMKKAVGTFLEDAEVEKVLVIVDRIQDLEVEHPIEGEYSDGTPQRSPLTDLEADDARMTMLLKLQKWTRSLVLGGFPVLGVSRVNKTERGRRLTLADVPGKAELVCRADSVLLLEPAQPEPVSEKVTPTILNIAKVRDGGLKGEILMDFHHTVSKFSERSGDSKGKAVPAEHSVAKPRPTTKRFKGK